MALLSSEELVEMQAFAAEQAQQPDDEGQAQGEIPQQASGEPSRETPQEPGSAGTTEPPSAAPEPKQHTVPYERLQQTIRERNEARRQISEMQQQVQHLQTQMNQRQAVSSQVRAELEREGLIDAAGQVQAEDVGDPRVQQLLSYVQQQQQALQQVQVAQAQQQLQAELAEVQGKFPLVPQKYLLKEVASDATRSLEEIAHEYMSWVTPHLSAPQAQQTPAAPPPARVQTPSAPPRPAKAGAASSSAGNAGPQGWGDRKSRTSQVAAMLGEMGWK